MNWQQYFEKAKASLAEKDYHSAHYHSMLANMAVMEADGYPSPDFKICDQFHQSLLKTKSSFQPKSWKFYLEKSKESFASKDVAAAKYQAAWAFREAMKTGDEKAAAIIEQHREILAQHKSKPIYPDGGWKMCLQELQDGIGGDDWQAKVEEGYVEALADCNKALELDPNLASGYNNRGFALLTLGNIYGALDDLNKAIELDPDHLSAYNNRGYVAYLLGESESAIQDYDHALQLNPNFAQAYNNRGMAKTKLGDFEGAFADYDKSLFLDPTAKETYYNRGCTKQRVGDHDSAIPDFDAAIQLDPTWPHVYFNRGVAKHNTGDYAGALADYAQAANAGKQNKLCPKHGGHRRGGYRRWFSRRMTPAYGIGDGGIQ